MARDTGKDRPAAPPQLPETTPGLPSGDYSYTLEVVMAMQNSVGKLTEAVETLKAKGAEHGQKLEQIGKDVHAAKVVIGLVGGTIAIIGAILAVVLKAILDYLLRTHLK